MCLIVEKGATVERTSRGKGLTVFKVLQYSAYANNGKGGFQSPIWSKHYQQGELKKEPVFAFEERSGSDTGFTSKMPDFSHRTMPGIGKGLHTYATLERATYQATRFAFEQRIVVECRIPRRTLFVRGRTLGGDAQLVSLALQVGKAVAGDPELVAKFNASKSKSKVDLTKMSKAAKLRYLASRLETDLRSQFNQASINNCGVALGARLNNDGSLDDGRLRNSSDFETQFGVSHDDTNALWTARYSQLGIDEPDLLIPGAGHPEQYAKVTVEAVARILRKLADKYAKAERNKTSYKLRQLAKAIRRNVATFSQACLKNCAVAIGVRLQPNGTLIPIEKRNYCNERAFADKFGVTFDEAHALGYAYYSQLGIGEEDVTMDWATRLPALEVARIVDLLANKYDGKGN